MEIIQTHDRAQPLVADEDADSQFEEEGSYIQQPNVPWIFTKNQYSRKPQINVILSILSTSTIFLSFYLFIITKSEYFVCMPVAVDVSLNAICLYLYNRHPLVFRVRRDKVSTVIKKELIFISIKVAISAVMLATIHFNKGGVLSVVMLLGLCSSIVVLDCTRGYDQICDSVFNLLGMSTLILAWTKLYVYPQMSWQTVLIFYFLSAWFTGIVFVIEFCIFIFLILYELTLKKRSISLKVALLHTILTFNFLFFSLSYFGIVNYFDGRETILGIPLEYVLVGSVVYFIVHGGVVVGCGKELDEVTRAGRGGEHIEERKGLNYILNMMRSTPTFFVANNENTGATETKDSARKVSDDDPSLEQYSSQPAECIICCERMANCVIFDCMHSGSCRECSLSMLKKNKACMICRKPIAKICVVEQKSLSEYKVIEELVLSPAYQTRKISRTQPRLAFQLEEQNLQELQPLPH